MKHSVPPRLRLGRLRRWGACGAVLALAWSAPQASAAPQPVLLAEHGLAELSPGAAWKPASRAATLAAACAPGAAVPRLALFAGPVGRIGLQGCRRDSQALVESFDFARFAVVLAVPSTGEVMPLGTADLFRAFGVAAGGTAETRRWNDVRAGLPSRPAGLSAARTGSAAAMLFGAAIMEPGCVAARAMVAFAAALREAQCAALRPSPDIAVRPAGEAALLAWTGTAPAGAVAVVTLAELRALQGRLLPVPIDGVLPTVGNIVSGAYAATVHLHLLIVLPQAMDAAAREAGRAAVFELLSERSLGPGGSMSAAGVIGPPAADRMTLRGRAFSLLAP